MPDIAELLWGLTAISALVFSAIFSFFSALVLVQHVYGIRLFTGI
jgi:hypothetical protein